MRASGLDGGEIVISHAFWLIAAIVLSARKSATMPGIRRLAMVIRPQELQKAMD
jgi:hypothetical protein